MNAPPRRAVLTGIGLISPLGLTVQAFREALREGRSGVRPIRAFDASALPTRFGGSVEGFDPREYLDKKDRKRLNTMPRTAQFGVAAARLAFEDAQLDRSRLDPERLGIVFGTGTIPGDAADLGPAAQASADGPDRVDLRRWGKDGLPLIAPTWMLNHVPNMPACHISILNDLRGPNNTITQTDAAGLLALGEAYRGIVRGRADLFLAGGTDDRINPMTLVRQSLYSTLSRRNDAPEQACRPFDRGRDGMVLGEGAGIVVLEEAEHARRRGARIYAEVVGFGAAFDADRSGTGLSRAIRTALEQAQVTPADLDHVNAHADGTIEGDAWEARGLREALGEATPSVPVFAPKSYFGNLGPGAAALELAASLLAFEDARLPATLNHDDPDPGCPVTVARQPRAVTRRCFLKISLTAQGQCAALVCRKTI